MSPTRWTDRDLRQLAGRGIAVEEAERQLELLRDPPPPARLLRPATVGDGIERLDAGRQRELEARGAETGARVTRFVPASGAASRMFRALLAFRADEASADDRRRAEHLVDDWRRLPFAAALRRALEVGGLDPTRAADLVEAMVGAPPGLALADLPKGLIPFHRTPDGARTAFEEHLLEAAGHARHPRTGRCRVHFTVPAEHRTRIERFLAERGRGLEEATGARFELSFSVQDPATDTVALEADGALARDEDGSLLLRPGGHGALLRNLDALGADLVVLKNVDNVQPAHRRDTVLAWKRILLGRLLELEERIDWLLAGLPAACAEELEDGVHWAAAKLGVEGVDPGADPEERRRWLESRLRRPLRVCGVVPNTGEPGGGPFWVGGVGRTGSLQIVETAQIDRDDPAQAEILANATHFNPVDVVARLGRSVTDRPLADFVDPRAAFVTRKSHAGRPVRVLEHPGLWNGAMAGWNTVFVEVPGETFAPVKTVFDLLRPEHRGDVDASDAP